MMNALEHELARQMKEELGTYLTNHDRKGLDRRIFVWVEYESLQMPGQYRGSFRNVSLQ